MKRTLSLAVFLPLGFHLLADDGAGWPFLDLEQWESMTPTGLSQLVDTHSVNARTERGATALMFAASHNSNPEVIQELVDAGAELNPRDKDGWTALMFAARSYNSNPRVGRSLLAADADPTLRTEDGKTAWDLIQQNEALRDTDFYWQLNDRRFEQAIVWARQTSTNEVMALRAGDWT